MMLRHNMIQNQLKKIKLLLLDVDGVLTDGSIAYDDNGIELKTFNVRDGLGIRLLMSSGIIIGIITGRSSEALRHRCRNLGISHLFDGVRDKAALLEEIVSNTGISAEEIAFMGDDLQDLALMRKVGVSIAVADSCAEITEAADWVTHAKGGRGAVREVSEAILKSQKRWQELIDRLFT